MLTKFQLYKSQTGFHTRLAATLGVPVPHARAFIHMFLLGLFNRILDEAIIILKCETEQVLKPEDLSETDQEVLFYVSGFVIKSMSSTWKGNQEALARIELKMTGSWASNPYNKWLVCVNRGGLKQPSEDMFYLIRNLELECRKHVNLTVSGQVVLTELFLLKL